MTLYHFGNCFALAYVPYFMAYKYSGLPEYGAFWKCIQAGLMYMVTQLVKMMFLATFFPAPDVATHQLDLVGEFYKSTVDLADLVGLHFIMTRVPGKGDLKCLVAGVGWGTAELVLTRFLPLWVGARGAEFNWQHIQMSLDSNISLVQHLTTAALVWVWGRNNLSSSLLPIVLLLMLLSCYKSLLMELMVATFAVDPWSVLAIKAVITLISALLTLQIYIGITNPKDF